MAKSAGIGRIIVDIDDFEGVLMVDRLRASAAYRRKPLHEIQADYAKTAYEGFVAQATKIGELYVDLAKETYKPFESYIAKTPAK